MHNVGYLHVYTSSRDHICQFFVAYQLLLIEERSSIPMCLVYFSLVEILYQYYLTRVSKYKYMASHENNFVIIY